MSMPTVSGSPDPSTTGLSLGWEVAIVSTFVVVIIAVLTVVVCKSNRESPDIRGIELEDGARSHSYWPASISNKRKRRRKKGRKTKARDPDAGTIGTDLKSEEIEEVESFEEDTTPVQMDVGTKSVSGS